MAELLNSSWKYMIEIIALWGFYYTLLNFIKDTRAIQVLKGLVVLIVIFVFAQELDLKVINWILTKIFTISVFAFLVIFQPELRRGLAQIGQFGMFYKEKQILDEIAKTLLVLSKKKVGALIAIEREIGLKAYIESGVSIDSEITNEIINTIFATNTPLHDGGIIIQGTRIAAAGCLFPLTQNPHVPKMLGTRHRAAIGLSEETDALIVVVSEETGDISVASGGKLFRDLDIEQISKELHDHYRPAKKAKHFFGFAGKRRMRKQDTENKSI